MVIQCMRTVLVAVQQSQLDSFLPSLPLPLLLPYYLFSPRISLLLTAEMEVKEKVDETVSWRERERQRERDRETETETETERQRETETETERQTERQREGERLFLSKCVCAYS